MAGRGAARRLARVVVLASRLPSIVESCGDAVSYYEPDDPADFMRALGRLVPGVLAPEACDWTRYTEACRRVYDAVGVAR